MTMQHPHAWPLLGQAGSRAPPEGGVSATARAASEAGEEGGVEKKGPSSRAANVNSEDLRPRLRQRR